MVKTGGPVKGNTHAHRDIVGDQRAIGIKLSLDNPQFTGAKRLNNAQNALGNGSVLKIGIDPDGP